MGAEGRPGLGQTHAYGEVATRNHASEFLPGGCCAQDQITPALRERLSGCPMTSTGAEARYRRLWTCWGVA